MNQNNISYALAKQVPDMAARGFSINTAYGELTIEPGWMAERIAQHVRRVLEAELLAPQASPATPAFDTTPAKLTLTGEAAVRWLDDYATGKLCSDGRDAQGFRLDRGLIAEFADLAEHHPAPPPCPANAAAQHAAPESQLPCAPAQPPATPETDGGLQ